MKSKITLLISAILTVLLVGCAKQPTTPSKTPPPKTTPSVVSTAPATPPKATPIAVETTSTVSTPAAFEKAISSNGTCIILATKNMAIYKDLIVNGEYKNGKKDASGKDILERKIDFRQDKDKTMTARLSLTVPKLTINSPQTNIAHGIIKGNIYVSSNNFQLIDTTVNGNVYFTTDQTKSTFKMDTKSKVTGKRQLLTPPKTTSIVNTPAAFEKAISSNGTCIIAITKNMTIDKNLVVNGEYKNGKKDASGKDVLERKINLYRQDKDKKIPVRLSLTVPKLTINSPQTNIEHGTFKGNIYVSSKNFKLIDAKVEGNIYFTTNEAKSTFKMDTKSKVTGKQQLKISK